MDVVNIFKKALDVFKANYVIAVPILAAYLIAGVLMLVLVGGALAGVGGMMAFGRAPGMGAIGAMAGAFGLFMILAAILFLFAQGAALGMAKEAIDTGKTTIKTGINVARERLVDLIMAAIIVGVLVFVGFALLVLPGLIIWFFLMLTFPSLIIDRLGAIHAVRKSFEVVKNNIGDALVLVVGIIIAAVIVWFVGMIFVMIPFLGWLIGLVLNSALWSYVAVMLALFYMEAKK